MTHTGFQKWCEVRDVFGFEKELYAEPKDNNDALPIKRLRLGHLTDDLLRYKLGTKTPQSPFVGHVEWGRGPGAIKVWIGTGLNVMFERLAIDLQGQNRWACKRVYQIPQEGYGGHEDAIAQEIMEVAAEIDKAPPESPNADYNDLESLVVAMSNRLKRVARDIFVFEGTRKVDDNQYIIRFSVRGHGVEAPDQQRVEEHQVRLVFYKDTGVIEVVDYNIESPIGAHTWEIMSKDTGWSYYPSQPPEEIIETIANTMAWY